ncbi:MAG: hypothetical protein HKP40_08190 [Litoreibacter sp.]|nr:hypothetical protein [Litoreibacter sp.]
MSSIYKDLESFSFKPKHAFGALFLGAALLGTSPVWAESADPDSRSLTVTMASETTSSGHALSLQGGLGQGSAGQGASAPTFLDNLRRTLERIAIRAGRPEVETQSAARPEPGGLVTEIDGLDPNELSTGRLDAAAPDSLLGRLAAYKNAILEQVEAITLLREAQGDRVQLANGYDRNRTNRIINAIGEMRENDPTNRAGLEQLHAELAASQAADRAYEIEWTGIEYDITVFEMVTRDARDTQSDALISAAGGRKLSPKALAELHERLGLAPPGKLDPQGVTNVSGDLPLDTSSVEG